MNSGYKRLISSCYHLRRGFFVRHKHTTHVCVIGSGPAGFYTAGELLQRNADVKVDMFEKCAVPYGLIRFGVAPDHPEVKNVINTFQTIAKNERFKFCGNVSLGKDVTLKDLQECYHAIILCTGCQEERKLGIPNEEHAISAQQFVGWYNGVEECANLKLNLDVETVAIIGNGNVALDVCRILLMPVKKLQVTDICQHALQTLEKSRVKCVYIIGRRGPIQSSFTMIELREIFDIPGIRPVLAKEDFEGVTELAKKLDRPKRRIVDLLHEKAMKPSLFDYEGNCQVHFLFKRSPTELVLNNQSKVEKLVLGINELQHEGNVVKAKPTGQTVDLSCGLVVRSIGYVATSPDPALPFDKRRGVIANNMGRVEGMPGIYCSGWIGIGPIGVIDTTMQNSKATAKLILEDIQNSAVPAFQNSKPGFTGIQHHLQKKGVKTVSFKEWEEIDRAEIERGKKLGKSREKILSQDEMLKITKV